MPARMLQQFWTVAIGVTVMLIAAAILDEEITRSASASSSPKVDTPPPKKTTPPPKTTKPMPKEPDHAEPPRPETSTKKPRKPDSDSQSTPDKPKKPIFKLDLPKTGATVEQVEDPLAKEPDDQEEGFKRLFDGKTLGRWQGDKKLWSVNNGVIVGKHDGLKGVSTCLIYPIKFADFVLKLRYKLVDDKGNSGVHFRSRHLLDKTLLDRGHNFVVAGYQADISDARSGLTGCCYEERGRGVLSHPNSQERSRFGAPEGAWDKLREALRTDDFNEYVITCVGKRVTIELNGVTTADFIDESGVSEGVIALQLHVGTAMEVHFKDIRIKRLLKE